MREEHNVRYDFDILLVATILSEKEKAGLVNAHRGRFEPENNIEDMKTLVIDDEDIKTEPLINCKFCEKTFCARVDLKNHMLNDHAKASTDNETNSAKVVNNAENEKRSNATVVADTKDKRNAKSSNDNSSPETNPAVPVTKSIEGVLKCKVCGKYVKQSVMVEHKAQHAENEKEAVVLQSKGSSGKSEEASKKESSPNMAASNKGVSEYAIIGGMASKANVNKVKVGDSTKKAESARPGKRKKLASKEWEEEDNDDPDDEDFDVEKAKVEARMSPKQLPCKYYSQKFGRFCSKKFSSKVRLLSHMKEAHEAKSKSSGQ